MRTKEVSETLGGCRGAELIINSEIKRNYNTIYPLCRKIWKMMIWGVPPSGGPILYRVTDQVGKNLLNIGPYSKMQLSNQCQQEVFTNLMCHPEATYCPSRPGELYKSSSSKPCDRVDEKRSNVQVCVLCISGGLVENE